MRERGGRGGGGVAGGGEDSDFRSTRVDGGDGEGVLVVPGKD